MPETALRQLWSDFLERWNEQDACGMGALFADDGTLVGFDGSQVYGGKAVEAHLAPIFAHHPTALFVGIVREARLLAPEVGLLRGVVGMIPRGGADINANLNAVQSLVATRQDGRWRITMLQNTPAAFHGRPDVAAALTHELRTALRRG